MAVTCHAFGIQKRNFRTDIAVSSNHTLLNSMWSRIAVDPAMHERIRCHGMHAARLRVTEIGVAPCPAAHASRLTGHEPLGDSPGFRNQYPAPARATLAVAASSDAASRNGNRLGHLVSS